MAKTYSFPKQDLYVMIPNQKTINEAHEKIREYLEDTSEVSTSNENEKSTQ